VIARVSFAGFLMNQLYATHREKLLAIADDVASID
jgi:hypothetical protein